MTGVRFKLDTRTIQKIALFESITRANLKDCIDNTNEVIFILSPGELRKAIGKRGVNVRLLEKKINKKIVFLEFSHDPKRFASNMLKPILVKSISLEDNIMNIVIRSSQRAFPSKKVKKTKMLLKKYFPSIEEVNVRV